MLDIGVHKDVHLCLTVGGTLVRRGKRLLRKQLMKPQSVPSDFQTKSPFPRALLDNAPGPVSSELSDFFRSMIPLGLLRLP